MIKNNKSGASPNADVVLRDMLGMIESDLMKAHHYLDKAIRISMVAQPNPELKIHQDIAQISVIIAREIKDLNHIQWQLASVPTKSSTKLGSDNG